MEERREGTKWAVDHFGVIESHDTLSGTEWAPKEHWVEFELKHTKPHFHNGKNPQLFYRSESYLHH